MNVHTTKMNFLLSLCFCLGIFTLVAADHCTKSNVDVCFAPLRESDIISNTTIVPTLTIDEMEEHCQIYKKFENCMVDIIPHCGDIDKRYFEGVNDAYHWLCEENFEGYKKHRDCFANTQLHTEGDICSTTYSGRLDALGENGQTSSYNFDRICHYSKDYLDCVYNAVESFCGEEAALWQREFDKRSLEPILELVACDISDKPEGGVSNVTIAIVCILVATVLLIVLIIIVYLYMRKRKRVPRSGPEVVGTPAVAYAQGAVNMGYPGAGSPVEAGPLPEKHNFSPPPYESHNPDSPPALGPGEMRPPMDNPYYAGHQPPPYSRGEQVDGAASVASGRASSMVSNSDPPAKRY